MSRQLVVSLINAGWNQARVDVPESLRSVGLTHTSLTRSRELRREHSNMKGQDSRMTEHINVCASKQYEV